MGIQLVDMREAKVREPFIALYETAFPSEERKPFGFMEGLVRRGKMEMLAVMDEGRFVGLAVTLLGEEAVLLDYLAIAPACRDCGYGGAVLGLLKGRYGGRRLILEIEVEDPQAENARERVRRKAFYMRNHMKETGVYAHVYHTDFELLSVDGRSDFEEYVQVMEQTMGADFIERLKPRQIFQDPGR